MKIGFIVPVLAECDLHKAYENINSACLDSKVEYEIIFAFASKLNAMFSKVRSAFLENKNVKAFKVDSAVNEHKLITLGLEFCEKYNATIIYSAKEEINVDVVKAFITSWKAGNKLVYLKKSFYGPKKIWVGFCRALYSLGNLVIGAFKDFAAETDIQLLDQDVVKAVNQLPEKNRQLRTLDSFIGYNYDIIHMEVDSKIKDSKYYVEKTKKYKVYKGLTWGFGVTSVLLLTLLILAGTLHWQFGALGYILTAFGFAVMVTLTYIFGIKKTLALRIGDKQDLAELKSLKSKIEKYNFN